MADIGAGDLRERVALQVLSMADDGHGGQIEEWLPVMPLWARVLPTGGREVLEGGALVGISAWRVTIRHRPRLGVQHRFVWRGMELNIRSIADPDGKRQWLTAYCEAGVAQ